MGSPEEQLEEIRQIANKHIIFVPREPVAQQIREMSGMIHGRDSHIKDLALLLCYVAKRIDKDVAERELGDWLKPPWPDTMEERVERVIKWRMQSITMPTEGAPRE